MAGYESFLPRARAILAAAAPVRRRRNPICVNICRAVSSASCRAQFCWRYCLCRPYCFFPPRRTNILLLGLDRRPQETTYVVRFRHDDLVHVNPASGYTGMLSIPRDLLVKLPGGFEGRIK